MISPYKDLKLIFKEGAILEPISNGHVMMDWEDEMMKEHAKVACHNQGDVLEVGFGMGISANYIQSFRPKSHTIMEVHPQILEKLCKWAKNKDNVNIIEGDWGKNLDKLKLYDGIFFDTYMDVNDTRQLVNYLKPGGAFTFYNGKYGNFNHLGLQCNEYKQIKVSPTAGTDYFKGDTYWLPIYWNSEALSP